MLLNLARVGVWANDANPDIAPLLHRNLTNQLQAHQFHSSHWPAQRVFCDCYQRRDYYDLVDLDHFGNPAAELSGCLQAARIGGLVYLTSTDGRTATGHAPEQSLRHFGAYARSHPAGHEQGLRLLLGSLWLQATMRGFSIQPIFGFFQGQIYRVMARLTKTHTGGSRSLWVHRVLSPLWSLSNGGLAAAWSSGLS